PYILAATPTIVAPGAVSTVTSSSGAAYWSANAFPSSAGYACTVMNNPTANGLGGPCIVIPATNDMVCCYIAGPGNPNFTMTSWDNGVATDRVSIPLIGPSETFIAVQRVNATDFLCYTSDGSNWTPRGTTQTIPNMGPNGTAAFAVGYDFTPSDLTVGRWEGGVGNLPAPAACGGGTTTTTTTTTLASTTTTSGGPTTTTTPTTSTTTTTVVGVQLYVDKDSKGGACSDGYVRATNNLAHPFCTIGRGVSEASMPGDTLNIRTSAVPYNDGMVCGGGELTGSGLNCTTWSVIEPLHKGTSHQPITIRAYPPDGGNVVIDPNGLTPPTRIYGVSFGITQEPGRCRGGARNGKTCVSDTNCSGGTCQLSQCFVDYLVGLDGPACNTNADCTASTSSNAVCRRMAWYVTFQHLTFQNWSWWDSSLTMTDDEHGEGINPQQYAFFVGQSLRPHPGISVVDSIFTNNNGGGVFFYNGSFGLDFERNQVHDNSTHGWTTAVNLWQTTGGNEGWDNKGANNFIYNNQDQPPPCCMTYMCSDPDGDGNPANDHSCDDTVAGKGFTCPCLADSDCQSGTCTGPRVIQKCANGGSCPGGNCTNACGAASKGKWCACSTNSECQSGTCGITPNGCDQRPY